MKDESWHVELLEIFRKIRLGECFDAVIDSFQTGLHALTPERVAQALRDSGPPPIGAKESPAAIFEELGAVGVDTGANRIENIDRQAAWIASRFQRQRRHPPTSAYPTY